jgi:hypothetical protein
MSPERGKGRGTLRREALAAVVGKRYGFDSKPRRDPRATAPPTSVRPVLSPPKRSRRPCVVSRPRSGSRSGWVPPGSGSLPSLDLRGRNLRQSCPRSTPRGGAPDPRPGTPVARADHRRGRTRRRAAPISRGPWHRSGWSGSAWRTPRTGRPRHDSPTNRRGAARGLAPRQRSRSTARRRLLVPLR